VDGVGRFCDQLDGGRERHERAEVVAGRLAIRRAHGRPVVHRPRWDDEAGAVAQVQRGRLVRRDPDPTWVVGRRRGHVVLVPVPAREQRRH
jgi:hypothetical protein